MPTVGLQAWAESGRAWGSLRGVWEEPGINLSGGFSKLLEPEPGVNCGLLQAFGEATLCPSPSATGTAWGTQGRVQDVRVFAEVLHEYVRFRFGEISPCLQGSLTDDQGSLGAQGGNPGEG